MPTLKVLRCIFPTAGLVPVSRDADQKHDLTNAGVDRNSDGDGMSFTNVVSERTAAV